MKTTLLMLVALLLLAALPARADRQEKQARVHFKQGVKLYDQGDHEQAAIAFERAYELKPSYKILFNLGQVYAELKQYAAALTAYERYFEEGKKRVPPKRRKLVEAEIERLGSLVGTIAIEGAAEGAVVVIDKEERGRTPLAQAIRVDLGRHAVEVTLAGERLLERVVKVGGGEQVVVTVEQKAPPQPAEEAAPTTVEEAPEEEPQRLWTWVAFGIGGAAAVGAAITGGLAVSRKSDLEDRCDGSQCTPAERDLVSGGRKLAYTTNALIGVAAAGVAAGVVLYFVEPGLGEERGLEVTPVALEGGGGIVLGGRF